MEDKIFDAHKDVMCVLWRIQ